LSYDGMVLGRRNRTPDIGCTRAAFYH